MNVLFIISQIQKGGGQAIQAINLAEHLIKKNNRVFFLTFKAKKRSKEISKKLTKFQIYCFNLFVNYLTILLAPFLIIKIKKLVQKWKINAIQSFDPHLSNLIAILLGKKLKIPVYCRTGARYREFYEDKLLKGNILTKLIYYTKIPSILLSLLEYYTILRTRITISNSYHILNALKRSFLLKFHNFNWKIVPNGVDLKKFSPNLKIPSKISEKYKNKKIILYIGRIEDYKGIDTLIKALAIVYQKIQDFHLILIGSYSFNYLYYKKLRSLINQLKLLQNISFLGEISHESVPFYLNLAEILILPSYSPARPILEGSPNIILEAMASQRVVIASKIGGIPEIIQNKKNGLLFEPRNYSQLADLLSSILENPKEFSGLAEYGRKYVMEKHAFQDIANKYLNLYNS